MPGYFFKTELAAALQRLMTICPMVGRLSKNNPHSYLYRNDLLGTFPIKMAPSSESICFMLAMHLRVTSGEQYWITPLIRMKSNFSGIRKEEASPSINLTFG